MNNEPVAWIDEQGEVFSNPLSAIRNQAKGNIIPLYTHPVTLTEDELAILIASVPIRPLYEDLVLFAGAILRKAGEK